MIISKLITTFLKLNFLKESIIKNNPTIATKDKPVHFILKDRQANADDSTKKMYDFLELNCASLKHKIKYKDKNPKNNRKISIKINFD